MILGLLFSFRRQHYCKIFALKRNILVNEMCLHYMFELVQEKTKIKEFKRVEDLKLDKGEIENLIRQQPISGCVKNVRSFKKHTGKVKFLFTQLFVYSQLSLLEFLFWPPTYF